jgi:hypothetical protein
MNLLCRLWRAFPLRRGAVFWVLACLGSALAALETGLPVQTEMLWSGSWEKDGNLANRADLRLGAQGFTLRAQELDRRASVFKEGWEENWAAQSPAFSGGLYHRATGSRALYGVLEEWGLSARLRNTWAKSLAYPAARKPLGADLKTEYSATGKDEAYLYLAGGRLGGAVSTVPSAALWIGENAAPAFGAGLDTRLGRLALRTEGFYTRKTLPASTASTWFSEPPPLPERDSEIYGAGVLLTSPWFAVSADGALSQVFGWGSGYYGSFAASVGSKPWQLSLGAEAAGEKFSDRDGKSIGAGLRAGARFEWKQSRSGLFRADAVLRAPAPDLPFNRGNFSLYYRFPAKPARAAVSLFRPGRISLSAARDGRNAANILDRSDAAVTWHIGPMGFSLSAGIEGIAAGAGAAEGFPAFPLAADHDFSSAKAAGELSFAVGIFQIRVKTGCTWTQKKDPLQDLSLSAATSGKRGRFSIKISSPDFPDDWTAQISWRLNI